MIQQGEEDKFKEKIKISKESFIPLPHDMPLNNLNELCCEQQRCYYNEPFFTPYKKRLQWQTWTKLQCKMLLVKP